MHSRLVAFIGLAGLLIATPGAVAAQGGCCQDKAKAASHAGCDMPCCKDHAGMDHASMPMPMAEANAVDIFFQMEQPFSKMEQPPVAVAAVTAPARQATVVWFNAPVRMGDKMLQGRYVIEHDNDRMARGEPCTHIYAFNDQKTPVVAFHCTHLDRPASKDGAVVLYSTGDGYKKFVEFQFAGETGAHGFPTDR
jgi:hypothetical protein